MENSYWLCRDYHLRKVILREGAFLCKTAGSGTGQHWALSPGHVFLLVWVCPVPRAMGMHSMTTACTFYFSLIKIIIKKKARLECIGVFRYWTPWAIYACVSVQFCLKSTGDPACPVFCQGLWTPRWGNLLNKCNSVFNNFLRIVINCTFSILIPYFFIYVCFVIIHWCNFNNIPIFNLKVM